MSDSSASSSPSQYRSVGIILAVGSGLLIGTSFVFKKKGLLKSQAGHAAGEGVAYLKSPMWWTGMILMICGETCNFGAYAFVEAIVVTPLGALSVVISAILSHIILKEKLTLFGWIGYDFGVLIVGEGAIIIALNGPEEQSVSTIAAFKKLFLAPGFLSYGGCCLVAALIIIVFLAPKYGTKSMIWYILVCSLIGGISVSCTQGLGACILTSIRGENQFKNWFIYFLLFFVICTLLTEIYFLNVALALFNTAMVTPTYYVLFTFFTLITSIILYQGLRASASAIVTIALGFLIICTGIFILQMSKIDPRHLTKLDRNTTMLLQAAREEVKPSNADGVDEQDEEKLLEVSEEPSMDSLAGRFSGVGGTLVRARRRVSIQSQNQKGRICRRRADTTASAPGPSLPRQSMQSVHSSSSAGIDSVHARQLHALWREEREEKCTADDGAFTEAVPAVDERKVNECGSTEATPTNRSSLNAHTNGACSTAAMAHILPNERLVSSPVETSISGLHGSHSVHFPDQSGRHQHASYSSRTAASPASPPPALVSIWSTPLPSLHLSTPSLHMPAFLSRGASGNSHPSPIPESDFEERHT